MNFQAAGNVETLPKRVGSGRKFNKAGADTLLKIVSAAPGATASDGVAYADDSKARGVAGAAKRLLGHVTDPATVKSRTYRDGESWRWVVYLKTPATVEESEPTAPPTEKPTK